jgi:cytochrome c biogenesis protein CcmG, thiol:disulfide interchange protein DsbE
VSIARRVLLLAVLALGPAAAAHALATGEVAPDFTRTDLQGKAFTLSALRGKVVLLNFWATWCAPCREEMPAFSAWQRSHGKQGLAIVGVSMDDDPGSVRQALATRPVSYPVVMGDAKLGERMGGVLGLPLSYLLDRDGRVVARYQGEASLGAIEARIKELLAARRR